MLPDVELRAGCVYFPGIIDSRISFTTCDNTKTFLVAQRHKS